MILAGDVGDMPAADSRGSQTVASRSFFFSFISSFLFSLSLSVCPFLSLSLFISLPSECRFPMRCTPGVYVTVCFLFQTM